ncbi:hypothetical protein OHA72_17950 [Dactylosporangium sp. NBC_01737]|uniref:hypothetical protein n=1 Tax=Dactylosporangium sp. NBC_01737 TaxID=2975959 RepID=UPI002E15F44B|nr:hypothetical protein OHA72_17950 [Dactylosporangium sp. NBC_01737]
MEITVRQKAAGWVGLAAVVCLGYGGYAFIVVQELKGRYGDDDRILVQQGHAAAGFLVGVVAAGWGVNVLRGGPLPAWRSRDWSGWTRGTALALLVGALAFAYDGSRALEDFYQAVEGRGVHGSLTVTECTPLEHGFECQGTFRAGDGSFEVERVSAGAEERPDGPIDGWVSGPRPLGMTDGTDGAWHNVALQLGVLAVFWLALAGFLTAAVWPRRGGPEV